MAYLTQDDLMGVLDERELAAIKRDYETDNIDKLPIGITYAENYVKDRIGSRYDMATEYAKTGEDRSTTLLGIISAIAIWKLAVSFPTIQLDGKRHYEYEQALKDLTDITKGTLLYEVLAQPATPIDEGLPVWGSNTNDEIIY